MVYSPCVFKGLENIPHYNISPKSRHEPKLL
jgi:hypothetical protein